MVNSEPNKEFRYSGGGSMIAQLALMDVSKKSFSNLTQEILFDKLGMKNSTFEQPIPSKYANVDRKEETIIGAKNARFYLKKEGLYMQAHRNSPHYGGSGVFTSINDWFKWDKNFYVQESGGKAFYDLMHKLMKFNHQKDNDAFGLVFGEYKGEEIIWYAGGDIGFNSYVMRFPKQQLTIVCFSNLDIGGNAERMAKKVADILAKRKLLKLPSN